VLALRGLVVACLGVVLVVLCTFSVGAEAAAVSAADSPTPVVYAWMTYRPPGLGISTVGYKGPKVRRLKAGLYTVHAYDPDSGTRLVIAGPGIGRHSTTHAYRGVITWRLRFRPGVYRVYAFLGLGGGEVRFGKEWRFTVLARS
jgi:hypothetical protein